MVVDSAADRGAAPGAAPAAGAAVRLLEWLPRGNTLDDRAWARRHRLLRTTLARHLPGIALLGSALGNAPAVVGAVLVGPLLGLALGRVLAAVAARVVRRHRWARVLLGRAPCCRTTRPAAPRPSGPRTGDEAPRAAGLAAGGVRRGHPRRRRPPGGSRSTAPPWSSRSGRCRSPRSARSCRCPWGWPGSSSATSWPGGTSRCTCPRSRTAARRRPCWNDCWRDWTLRPRAPPWGTRTGSSRSRCSSRAVRRRGDDVDLRRIDDCFPAIDYFESRRLPFVVGVNRFPGTDAHDIADVRDALALPADVPVVRLDARAMPRRAAPRWSRWWSTRSRAPPRGAAPVGA